MSKLLAILFFVINFSSCQLPWDKEDDLNKGNILAEVGNKKLYAADITSIIHAGTSAEDSMRILKGLVNNWVKDQLMILEAEKNLPKDINLNKMIDDYRSSLLLYNYESRLATEFLDTLVTVEQKKEYFNANADEFVLSESIGKYMLAKIPSNVKGLENFHKAWKKGDKEDISDFCNEHAEYSDLDNLGWKTISQLESFLPKNFIPASWYGENKDMRKKEKGHEYFIKIINFTKSNERPPFEYIEAKIEKVILNERKIRLLKQKKQQLFDKEFGGSKVKLYVN
ncbi:MAG: hypothetical protein IPN29_18140 [Saprospiraceae bacterium]|nr:hypothetical protein [Saprospiraceae bacterium]